MAKKDPAGAAASPTKNIPAQPATKAVKAAKAIEVGSRAKPVNPLVAAALGLDPPSGALDATAVVWSFFAAHPRQ